MMAAQEETTATQNDPFTLFPPELVLHIILYLPLKHLLPCMSVSRTWLSILSGMEPYWKQACEDLGLSSQLLEKLLTCYHTARAVLFAVLNHQRNIIKSHPRNKKLSSKFPYNLHYVCHYSKGNQFVGTIYKDFQPHEMVLERMVNGILQRIYTISPAYPRIVENRTIWVHVHNQYLFCATGSGVWTIYDTKSSCDATAVLQFKTQPMYDTEIKIACCDSCSMICTGKLVTSSEESFHWEVKVVEIFMNPLENSNSPPMSPRVTKFKVRTNNDEITNGRNSLVKKKIALLSRSTAIDGNGLCSSHSLLLQWANVIEGHVICCRSKQKQCVSRVTEKCFMAECRKSDFDKAIMKNSGLNTEFVLTEDNSLIGLIFQSQLITWETKSSHLSSSVRISLENYSHEEMKLISLGHIYSIIGLEFSGTLMIVTTRTGQQILKYNINFVQQHCRQILSPIEFFSSDQEKWLSDITQSCKAVLTYWNGTVRSIEAVEFGES